MLNSFRGLSLDDTISDDKRAWQEEATPGRFIGHPASSEQLHNDGDYWESLADSKSLFKIL